jgi:hypothetical protein
VLLALITKRLCPAESARVFPSVGLQKGLLGGSIKHDTVSPPSAFHNGITTFNAANQLLPH